ncbi:pyrimidine reductase [Catellatospora sp. IY07-71]|uniref:dihydrofolate reductase family protein n=1 Tax=Catellatospora sp. IY07-71 TaxID=2728827 RepID=UPI001BB35595|nr:dihydrofolate reductase family protein [Catellatospora sp. IY07-71]BCJ74382.1 pyrimidine reductase [Catellatospora sp. IY07-71]
MRKIVAGIFLSLDGVAEAPETWHFPYFNDEMGAAVGALMSDAEITLLGRTTYEGFAAYWPNSEDEMAAQMNDARKVVVSTTLKEATWQNTTVVRDLDGVRALKEEPGGTIGITGSLVLVRSLLRAGLLDELHLMVHPIWVGHGERLFDEGETVPLTLVKSETFKTGVLNLTYTRA